MKGKGVLLVISGPSGSGKGTVVNQLIQKEGHNLSVSATTRSPRPGEVHGVHYFFTTREEFLGMAQRGELLEWAEFCGNCYGTPKAYVEEKLAEGENVLLEIEVQGALQVKEIYPDAVLLFLIPPTVAELRTRLVGRGTEDIKTIDARIRRALEEIELFEQYDYVVINDQVGEAVEEIETILAAERLKCSRNIEAKNRFKGD